MAIFFFFFISSHLHAGVGVCRLGPVQRQFREGLDKPDPPTWKTRLRCALNKSNDFDELVERSQLDISDPYKVYRIIPEAAKRGNSHFWIA